METLTVIIYVLLIILIMVAIVIGVKLIMLLNKVDLLVDDVTKKVKTFDRMFEIVDVFNNKMSALGETVVGFLSGGIKKLFKSRKKHDYDKEEEDE